MTHDKWIKDWLTDRSQKKVVATGEISVEFGVREGFTGMDILCLAFTNIFLKMIRK